MLNKINLHFLLRSLTPAQTALITLWILMMISLPIVDWAFGWEAVIGAIYMGVLAQTSAVIAVLWRAWGAAKTLKVSVVIVALSWAAEALGSKTGFPFGAYSYTDILKPQIWHVPVVIPLAWLMMLPPSWAVAQAISNRLASGRQPLIFVTLSAASMTAWDFVLDPQMVTWGLWEWHSTGGFFGIPWVNYLGRIIVSALITLILRPRQLPMAPLLLIYTVTWLLEMIGLAFFWNMPGPALVGGLAMGSLSILAWRTLLKDLK